ncbi:MAG: helix-turn-helix domain-containing protein [Gemmatimonadota bacterium]|nr:helix-turn-helix domain-containing protein [Gemmatimonadota bacterium]
MPVTELRRGDTGSVITWAHDVLGLTYPEIADIIGTTERTIYRWRDRQVSPSAEFQGKLDRLGDLRFWLDTVFHENPERAERWIATGRLIALEGQTPLAWIRRGELDRVIEVLASYHNGAFV